MTDRTATLAATHACPFAEGCHFPRLPDPTASDRILHQVYCGAVWSQCSIFTLLAHGHDVSTCLWPDGEVKAVEEMLPVEPGAPQQPLEKIDP